MEGSIKQALTCLKVTIPLVMLIDNNSGKSVCPRSDVELELKKYAMTHAPWIDIAETVGKSDDINKTASSFIPGDGSNKT